MYQNNSAYPFEAFVTNLGKYTEGELVGEWAHFPMSREEMNNLMTRIQIGAARWGGSVYEEYFITDFEDHIAAGNLTSVIGEYTSLNELNYLANVICELDETEEKVFRAVMETEYITTVKDVINLTQNLDQYDLQPAIQNDSDLGYAIAERYDIPEEVEMYIDYEAMGRDESINAGGRYTEWGYLTHQGGNWVEIYDGTPEHIPEEYRVLGSAKPAVATKSYEDNSETVYEQDVTDKDPEMSAPRM